LRHATFDIVENECLCRFDRRAFQKRQVSPLSRDDVEGSMKAFDMVLRYWNNFDRVHRLGNVLIRPLAESLENNYLGCDPQTMD
jgi:hypothetical protein